MDRILAKTKKSLEIEKKQEEEKKENETDLLENNMLNEDENAFYIDKNDQILFGDQGKIVYF